MRLFPLGDSAVVVALGSGLDETTLQRARAVAATLDRHRPAGVVDVVAAFATVTVFYDPARIGGYDQLVGEINARVADTGTTAAKPHPRLVEIPVCYGGEQGPDITAVAEHCGLAADEVVALHGGADYLVHAVGFAPGFGYLGGLPEKLRTPRRATPRTSVPAGSVGIGGGQTGVYPLATPGGWNLIGRTPLRLFDPSRREPALLAAGDRVKFRPISTAEFMATDETASLARRSQNGDGKNGGQPAGDRADGKTQVIAVVRAGMLTTVQDLGRCGQRAAGVPRSGAMDAFALRVANLLVGNNENAAVLEFAFVGPELEFPADTVVALGGGEFEGLPRWQPVRVAAGARLKLGAARSGCRGYLAIAGGLEIEPVLGSRSTFLRGAFGGFQGRALRDGDALHAPVFARQVFGGWHIDERILPAYSTQPTVRVVRGEQAGEFGDALYTREFKVAPQSDRMGVRLVGSPLERAVKSDLASSAVVSGTVQVPSDGQPIVLMADAQTIGGYPQIAHVIDVDLPLVAQIRPGDALRFREVTLAEAHELARGRERALAILHEGLAQKFL